MRILGSSILTLVFLCGGAFSGLAQPGDPGWPRIFASGSRELTVYQPQIDYWRGYTNAHFRCAIGVKGVLKQERFGVAEIDAETLVDQAARIVALVPVKRELRFPNTSDAELAVLRGAVDQLRPPDEAVTISLDRVLACLEPKDQTVQHRAELNLNPPKVFYSAKAAILMILMGEPQFKPVDENNSGLLFALNTNWDLFYDTITQRYYLLNQDNWLSASAVTGPWSRAEALPTSLWSLPNNDNWSAVRTNLPGKQTKLIPEVFVSYGPAELIVTRGAPSYSVIAGTQLLRVANTESVLFKDMGDGKFYYLVAGRWFRSGRLDGAWSAASADLPADFARIPDSDPAAFVKASVPGTREASDAVLLASIPTTTTVYTTNPTVQVVYSGTPQFVAIPASSVQYAVNTPQQVLLVGGSYYCCDAGVWFVSPAATGPWVFCTSVPAAIYSIPPSNPCYNVTYVVVQSSTPTTVVYAQTAGYSGEYVAATGVLMFGAGMSVGAALADSHYYYPPYPSLYSYGCGATYHYGYGGYYYGGGAAYGPYGGAGYATAYNPATGTYSRSAYAYGPYGSASAHATYNPYTGGYSRSAQVNTAYGSAGRAGGYNAYTGTAAQAGYRSGAYGTAAAGRAYNPYSGATAAGASVSTAYGTAGRAAAYNPTTGSSAQAAYQSGQYGSVGGVKTSQGAGAASWSTPSGQGGIARSQSGDVYAAHDGSVYKKDSDGGWSQNSGTGWESVSRPQPQTASYQTQRSYSGYGSMGGGSWEQNRQSLESEASSRSWGNQQAERAQTWQRSGGGRSWGGGGGWRR